MRTFAAIGRRAAQFLRRDQGATAAEFALVVPVMVILTFGIFNGCAMVYAVTALHSAVDHTARYLSINSTCSNSAAQTEGKTALMAPGKSVTFTCTTANAGCKDGSYVTATLVYPLSTGISTSDININATSCYPAVT
jgi:Flp pilus assembly protein TadG